MNADTDIRDSEPTADTPIVTEDAVASTSGVDVFTLNDCATQETLDSGSNMPLSTTLGVGSPAVHATRLSPELTSSELTEMPIKEETKPTLGSSTATGDVTVGSNNGALSQYHDGEAHPDETLEYEAVDGVASVLSGKENYTHIEDAQLNEDAQLAPDTNMNTDILSSAVEQEETMVVAKLEDEALATDLLAVSSHSNSLPIDIPMDIDGTTYSTDVKPALNEDRGFVEQLTTVEAEDTTPPLSGKYECRRILLGHNMSVSALKFSQDGTMLASCGADKSIKIWDAVEGHIMYTFEGHTMGISDVAWSNDCEYVASASDDKTVRIWSIELASCVKVLNGHTNFVFCLNFNPTSSLLVSGGYDESVRVWDVARGKSIRILPAHSDPVTAVSFNHDGSLIVSCAVDGLIRIWDTDSGQCLKTLVDDDNPACSHVEFSPNSKFILATTQDSTIRLWNCSTSRCVKSYTGHINRTYCLFASFGLAPSVDGQGDRKVVISGSEDNKVYIWDLQTRQVIQTLEGHRDVVLAVATHPTKKMIASASKEKDLSIRLWQA